MKRVERYYSWLVPIVAAACILFPDKITAWLPTILGIVMIITGLLRHGFYLRYKAYNEKLPVESAFVRGSGADLILVIMGIAFLIKQGNAIGLMGTTWGLIGLFKVTTDLDNIFKKHDLKEKYGKELIVTLIKLALSLALLFDPFEKFTTHIVLLGIEMLVLTVHRQKTVKEA